MSSTPEKPSFTVKHPMLYGAASKTFKVGKEQILTPSVMALITYGITWLLAWASDTPFSLKMAMLNLVCAAVVGFLLYFLFNLSREPLAVLKEHQALLNSAATRLQVLETPPTLASPSIAVAIREALVESDSSGRFACFLNINIHNETDVETNLTDYSLSVKISGKEHKMEKLLEISAFYLGRVVYDYLEDYEEPDEREINREDLQDFLANVRQQPLLKKAPSVFGWIGFTTYHARLPMQTQTVGYNTYSVQNEEGEYDVVEDPVTLTSPNFKALTEMTLGLTDGYNQSHWVTIQAPSFRQYGKRIKRREA